MMSMRDPRQGNAERGVAALEFAIVVPLLLMIVFGVISFGFVLAQKAGISNGVRTGARYGSVNVYASGHTCGNVIRETRKSATTIGIVDGTEVAVTVKRGATTVCSAARGTPTPIGGLPPCTNPSLLSTGSETLFVEARFPAKITIPGVSIGSFDLVSTGAYRCEYK